MRLLSRCIGILALTAAFVAALAAAPVFAANGDGLVKIPPVARVIDLTGTLNAAQKSSLDQELAQFEQRKGSQIAVLMLPSTKPEEIEQYAIRVFDQWKLGRKGTNDGLLIVVAKDDRRVFIQVGRGLEGAVTDVIASRVIREIIAPHFLAGAYYDGIEEGVGRIIGLVDGEPLPPPPPRSNRARQGNGGGNSLQSMLVIGFVLVFVVGGLLIRLLGRVLGSGLIGVVAAILAFVLAGGVAVAVIAGIAGFIAALIFGGSGLGGLGYGGFGGFGGGGFGGGGGGGGFSGGGGDSAGGGASGSW